MVPGLHSVALVLAFAGGVLVSGTVVEFVEARVRDHLALSGKEWVTLPAGNRERLFLDLKFLFDDKEWRRGQVGTAWSGSMSPKAFGWEDLKIEVDRFYQLPENREISLGLGMRIARKKLCGYRDALEERQEIEWARLNARHRIEKEAGTPTIETGEY